jgi:uncharacterized protein
VDTGPIVAILSASDEYHESCTEQLRKIQGKLISCWPVIAEAAWLLRTDARAVERLLSSLNAGLLELASLDRTDTPAIATILARYRDLRIQLADACLVHLANREAIETVFTLDRRDFSVLRRAGGKKFSVLP